MINSSWRPYFDSGRWVYTDCGWYWLSDYSWGWAPFHYGRWFRHQQMGWFWSPDNVWGPSWVTWRFNNDYCGWAPLSPRARFAPGTGFAWHGRADFGLALDCYAFIPFRHFRDHHLQQHALSRNEVIGIYSTTTASTAIVADHNRISNNAIPPERVAAATGTRVTRIALRDTNPRDGKIIRAERVERNAQTLALRSTLPDPPSRNASQAPERPARPGVRPSSVATTATESFQQPSRFTPRQPPTPMELEHTSLPGQASALHRPSVEPLRATSELPQGVLRVPNRAAQFAERNSETIPSEAAPHNSVIVIGQSDAAHRQAFNHSAPSAWPRPESQHASPPQEQPLPPTVNQHWQTFAPPTLPQPSAHYEPPARSASYEAHRYTPSQSFAPQHEQSAPATQTHSAPSAPSAPAASHSHSDKNGR